MKYVFLSLVPCALSVHCWELKTKVNFIYTILIFLWSVISICSGMADILWSSFWNSSELLVHTSTNWLMPVRIQLPYARHHNQLLFRNHSWILTILKSRILRKKPLEKTFLDFKKWVKSIQTVGYNGPHTVVWLRPFEEIDKIQQF